MAGAARVQFLGACGCVTGSKFMVSCSGTNWLVDCGLFQGAKDLRLRNWSEPPFDVGSIDGIVLTHAHIDHTGYLPVVYARGFRGPVYATPATIDLMKILLPDSARLAYEEAKHFNKYGVSKHKPAKPLFGMDDVKGVLKLVKPVRFERWLDLSKGCRIRMTRAGHILGSASVLFEATSDKVTRQICFSGDIGRFDMPILVDPQPCSLGDLFVCESTYGNRVHSRESLSVGLAAVVNATVERGGPMIVPAFSVGRTQHLLYELAELERQGLIPGLPVFVDSPMAISVTQIYKKYNHDFDSDAQELLQAGLPPLETKRTFFCNTRDESKALNALRGPRIIISASGMATGGRVLHHLRHWLDSEDTTVVFVGYQAYGTRGWRIQRGEEKVKIYGSWVPVRAKVETISGLSAHGDKTELVRWIKSCSGRPGAVRLVHGEPDAARDFAKLLQAELRFQAKPAQDSEIIEV